jgi:hypothetical protein
MHSVSNARRRPRANTTVRLIGAFAAGVVAAWLLSALTASAPAVAPRLLSTAEWLRSQLDVARPMGWTCGAKPMDPPVLPRLLNALKFELSEENFDATIGLLADTPDATVCSSAHPPLASHCSRWRFTRVAHRAVVHHSTLPR